jgi:hypothetical protein
MFAAQFQHHGRNRVGLRTKRRFDAPASRAAVNLQTR